MNMTHTQCTRMAHVHDTRTWHTYMMRHPPPLHAPPQVTIQARKPDLFNANMSLYEIVIDDGLMRHARTIKEGGVYCGGSAEQVEAAWGVSGDAILYIGAHACRGRDTVRWMYTWMYTYLHIHGQ